LLGAIEGNQASEGDQAAIALGKARPRSQMSPERTCSVSATSFGAISPIISRALDLG
jgi:hypothetical protein